MSRKKIDDGLERHGINVSQQTVSSIKRNIGLQRNSVENIKFSRHRPVTTPSTVSKVIQAIDVNDPPTQRSIAKSCHASQSTTLRIIKQANFTLRKKRKVHKLTSSNAEKHRRRPPRFYRQLANNRYNNFITTDESWFYLDGTEGKRKVCYIKKSDPDYDRMILEQDSSRPQGFMVWAGISSYGETSLRFVKPGVKINSDYYINNILKPFFITGRSSLVFKQKEKEKNLHQDNAPSHVSNKTIAFLNASKVKYVKPEE
ncbi:unnamed protein product [Rotaria socialis]|uniref:Transposase n=1 Tax=Rotaria socialis TaxID=392032 RepID=A0A820XDQ9_9BILA|nr:unnamed protein product [Rotaria socialis]CAF4530891.1 unnamed protein product [Rotaria socialis]